jgi:hypothetical protein
MRFILTTSKKIPFEKQKNQDNNDLEILEKKTTDQETLKKILDIEKSILKRARKLGLI